jgi:hypothetical protein
MPDDFSMSLVHKDFEFDFACDALQIADSLSCPHNCDIKIKVSDTHSFGSNMKVELSPRAVATFVFGALVLNPVRVCKELNEQRERMSVAIPRLLKDSLSRDCCWPDAWAVDSPEAEFTVHVGSQDYGSYFQKCGEFDLRNLRWRITRHGIEISDIVLYENFDTQEEWERNCGDFDADMNEEERHNLYLEELEEGTWPVSYVRFSLKLSFACLVEILVRRAELGLEWDPEISDSQKAQQWTDIFATLTMIMARLPAGFTTLSSKDLLAEINPLATNAGKRRWPLVKRIVGKYNRPLTKKYAGFALSC